jgi:hypothetical protein
MDETTTPDAPAPAPEAAPNIPGIDEWVNDWFRNCGSVDLARVQAAVEDLKRRLAPPATP